MRYLSILRRQLVVSPALVALGCAGSAAARQPSADVASCPGPGTVAIAQQEIGDSLTADGLYDAGDPFVVMPGVTMPDLTNPKEIERLVEQLYPRELMDRGLGGTARYYVLISAEGKVRRVQVAESSTRPALDAAGERVLRQAQFTPPRVQGCPVATWVQLPVTFSVR